MSAIYLKTPRKRISSAIDNQVIKSEQIAIQLLSYIGERCVEIARQRGSYNDITGNLRSSIGYTVTKNGREIIGGFPKQYSGSKGNGKLGAQKANQLLKKLTPKYKTGLALIVCAAMGYAEYVEAVHHKDVITSAELLAEELANKLLSNFRK